MAWNQIVGLCAMSYVLESRPTILIFDQYIRKQNGIHLSGIQMLGLSSIQMAIEYRTIWYPTFIQPFDYQTCLVFRSPLYTRKPNTQNLNFFNTKHTI